jgi:hypothetical protein
MTVPFREEDGRQALEPVTVRASLDGVSQALGPVRHGVHHERP